MQLPFAQLGRINKMLTSMCCPETDAIVCSFFTYVDISGIFYVVKEREFFYKLYNIEREEQTFKYPSVLSMVLR